MRLKSAAQAFPWFKAFGLGLSLHLALASPSAIFVFNQHGCGGLGFLLGFFNPPLIVLVPFFHWIRIEGFHRFKDYGRGDLVMVTLLGWVGYALLTVPLVWFGTHWMTYLYGPTMYPAKRLWLLLNAWGIGAGPFF